MLTPAVRVYVEKFVWVGDPQFVAYSSWDNLARADEENAEDHGTDFWKIKLANVDVEKFFNVLHHVAA